MHPLIARYLNLDTAVATLESEGPHDADATAFAHAAERFGNSKRAVLAAKGRKVVSQTAQEALMTLCIEGAVERLLADPQLGPKLTRARQAFEAEGATSDQAHTMISFAVLEEAFGYADSADRFDEAFLAETFDSLVPLAKVDSDTVEEWQMAFSRSGGAGARELRFKVAELLFMTAWDEGPQPISAEHIDDFYAIIVEDVAAKDLPLLDAHLPALLEFLAKKQLIGPLRLERLSAVHRTVLADVLRHNEGDDEGDESDDDAGDDEDE